MLPQRQPTMFVILESRGGVLATAFLIVSLSYFISVAIYRLYLSPIAKFPGPRLAAVTYLYEIYYDAVKRGKYTFKIRDLHAIYAEAGLLTLEALGPIIRISPTELHINDPDYYDSLYNREGKWDKNPFYVNSFGNTVSGFGTVDHDLHRLRRAAINPFFSKQKVAQLQPVIQRLADKLCKKLETIRKTDEVVPIECAFDAFTMDVITEYSLDTSFGYLDNPGWSSDFRELERALGEMSYIQKLFPPLTDIMNSLPDWLVLAMNPRFKLLLDFLRECYAIAERMLVETDEKKYKEKEHPTIFYEIIHSDLPPSEKTPTRLQKEAALILGAGAVTTAWTLTVALYHLTVNLQKLERLQAEIRSIMPNPHQPAKLQKLEQLPYLTAVIMESLRLSNGVSTRLARIAPDRSIYFRDWEIPRGTPVGMTSTLIHQNPDIFPQPLEFIPERWLDQQEGKQLERYLVPFSRGTRQCAGIKFVTRLF
ncbi:MAG: hypothetical protein MMC33_003382 [Icmadophila ericetorum]|nr:hypothetical protein [Icmadophila ericetorum]